MKKLFLSCFGFACLLFSKAFTTEPSDNLLFYLSFKESKILSLHEISFAKESPKLFKKYAIDKDGKEYLKFAFYSSYSVGRDVLNRGGGALAYYWNPNISVKAGPSWCRDIGINKKWKWAMQLNYEIPFA